MKYISLLTLLVVILGCSSSKPSNNSNSNENFTGKILYKYVFTDNKTGADLTNAMGDVVGTEQHYYINSSNYKANDQNGDLKQLYNSSDNTYYYTDPYTKEILNVDASFNMSEIISITEMEDTETILGRVCNKLVITTKTNETTYFYSKEIAVDPSNFSKHQFGDWSTYLEASNGALPLKYIVKNNNYTWSSTAVEITPMELTDEDFQLDRVSSSE
jgi:hypothetical protein